MIDALEAALGRRPFERWHAEDSTIYRILHGVAEGAPGVTLDRYGPALLVQTWRDPIDLAVLPTIGDLCAARLGAQLDVVWNHRASPVDFPRWHDPPRPPDPVGRELGLGFDVRLRHRGQDPLLFVDLRAVRRRLRTAAAGKRVLNLFAYTGGVGVAAAAGGAASVDEVDFSASALAVARANHARNGSSALARAHVEDALGFMRGTDLRWDLVVMDPPTRARSRHGVVDIVRDYPALLKPALLMVAPGGRLVATHHAAGVSAEAFGDTIRRCVDRSGRRLEGLEITGPEEDIPSFDGRPPLKVAWMDLG